jgi:16S rRNA (cytosine967-C5)-methyltransferase
MKEPRLFPNTVAGVLEALEMSFGKGIYADKVVERLLKKNKKWGSRDRSFVAEHTYEMVRWWGLLWALYEQHPSTKRKDLQKLFGIYWLWRGFTLPDWPKFDAIRDFPVNERKAELQSIADIESFPHWFNTLAEEQLGDKWPIISHNLNVPNTVNIRINTLKASKADVINDLNKVGIEVFPHPVFPSALYLSGRPRLNHIPSFQSGLFEVQDAGSQQIGHFLNPLPGSTTIDACAGAGGKTLLLGQLMNNQGRLIAMDIEGRKLGELKKRTVRSGLSIVETRAWEEPMVLDKLHEVADFLLLDVPCSGTGVIKREPDTKWKLQPSYLDDLIGVQADILHRYPRMLKNGGLLVYATCSILPMENSNQVQLFLENNAAFELIEERTVDPGQYNDGFYMAKMKKK